MLSSLKNITSLFSDNKEVLFVIIIVVLSFMLYLESGDKHKFKSQAKQLSEQVDSLITSNEALETELAERERENREMANRNRDVKEDLDAIRDGLEDLIRNGSNQPTTEDIRVMFTELATLETILVQPVEPDMKSNITNSNKTPSKADELDYMWDAFDRVSRGVNP